MRPYILESALASVCPDGTSPGTTPRSMVGARAVGWRGVGPCGCPGPLALVKEGEMHPKKYNSDLSIRYKRQSLRMPKHNYGWTGTYFVTIRAVQREPIFETPELCTILIETWKSLPERFVGATLDEFVIMPDHIHFIIELEGNVEKP